MISLRRIDTRGLSQAVAIAQQYSKRTPAQMAGTAAYFVARKTSRDTARTSMSKMDSELGATTSIRYTTKKGNRLLKKPKRTVVLGAGPAGDITVAEKIILARFWTGSRYNQITQQRFGLNRASFSPGEGTAAFWAKVAQVATRMVGSRHSSVAFLAASLVPVIKQLETSIDPRYRSGGGPVDSQALRVANSSASTMALGRAEVTNGGNSAVAKGSMLIGMVANALSSRRNEAMHRFVGPALQGAINDETARSIAYSVGKEEMLQRSARLAAAGVRVKV